MTLRALRRPTWNTNNVLLAMTMSASVILLGCGGGGGGGGVTTGPGVCGSPANSTNTVVCGRVVTADVLQNAVAGATVSLTNDAGTVLAATTTDSQGGFVFTTIPAGSTLFKAQGDAAAYVSGFARYNGGTYYYPNQNGAKTGPCLPALPALVASDNRLSNVGLYRAADPPPPPFGCPR